MTSLAAYYRVLALDYVGTGDSDKPAHGFGYTPQEQSDVIAAYLDAVGAERAHMMGVSYGGTIVLNFAGRHPERTSKAIAIEGFISVEMGLPGWSRLQSWIVSTPAIGDLFFAVVRSGLFNEHFARHIAGPWWDEMSKEERREWRCPLPTSSKSRAASTIWSGRSHKRWCGKPWTSWRNGCTITDNIWR